MPLDAQMPTVLSLFSGAGGMDIGFERAGYRHIAHLEYDEEIRRTLTLNRPTWRLWGNGDVISAAQSMKPEEFGLRRGDLDVLAGGPPCQPFSTAGQWSQNGRRGMGDERAKTVHALLSITETFLPKVVLLENVLGFIEGRNSARETLEVGIEDIRKRTGVEYKMRWQLVDAAHYGVPQHRRRVVVSLTQADLDWKWPHLTHLEHPLTAWDALASLEPDESQSLPVPVGKWSALLPLIPEGQNYQWLTNRGGGPELFGYRTKYWNFLLKLSKERPSWTLPASPGPSTGPFHWDNRPLTSREAMRLQSFPGDWIITGDRRQQIKQIGNATPPLLAEVFAREIRHAVLADLPTGNPTLLLPRASKKPVVHLPTTEVPPAFAHLHGPKPEHAGTGLGPAPQSKSAQILQARPTLGNS